MVLEANGAPDAISVRVKNQGAPIPADALQVIFNPLVQMPALARGRTEPRVDAASGWDFSSRASIVVGHGGTLEVESSRPEGTRVHRALPARHGCRRGATPGASADRRADLGDLKLALCLKPGRTCAQSESCWRGLRPERNLRAAELRGLGARAGLSCRKS